MDERYMYTVCPRIPIRGLVKGRVIVKPENLSLSKDEVLECMKHGRVYRKFYCEMNPEAVTPSNLDRLHRKDHLTEEQYKALTSNCVSDPEEGLEKKEDAGQLPLGDEETDKTETETPEKAAEKQEEVKEPKEEKSIDEGGIESDTKVEKESENVDSSVVYSGSIVVDQQQADPEEGLEKKEDAGQLPLGDEETDKTETETPEKAAPKNSNSGNKNRSRQNKGKNK